MVVYSNSLIPIQTTNLTIQHVSIVVFAFYKKILRVVGGVDFEWQTYFSRSEKIISSLRTFLAFSFVYVSHYDIEHEALSEPLVCLYYDLPS